MADTWNTRWGARQVRHLPPTLREALTAAQGFADDRDAQIEIAAGLMGVSQAEAMAEFARHAPEPRGDRHLLAPTRNGGTRTVVVERKASRRSAVPVARVAAKRPL